MTTTTWQYGTVASVVSASMFLLAAAGCSDSMGGGLRPGGGGPGDDPSGDGDGGNNGQNQGGDSGTKGPDGSNGNGDPDGGGGATGVPFVYVASAGYDGDPTNMIYTYALDAKTGALTPRGTPIAAGSNPSYLATDPTRHYLYAVNEGSAQVAAFSIDQATGALTFLNRVGTGGNGPTHVSVDRQGKFALVANYTAGSVAAIRLGTDGKLGASVGSFSFGANQATHWIATDPANKFALVANKDGNTIARLAFDATSGALSNNVPLNITPGIGPRHVDFHPNGRFAYAINELASTMTAYSYDAASGKLTEIQTPITTLPAGAPANTGAEIQVAPSGKFVYASNRGHDSIVTFSINQNDGKLTLVGHTKTRGTRPRHFSIDASGRFLLAANQGSGNFAIFRVDVDSGALTAVGDLVNVKSPAYAGVVYLPGS